MISPGRGNIPVVVHHVAFGTFGAIIHRGRPAPVVTIAVVPAFLLHPAVQPLPLQVSGWAALAVAPVFVLVALFLSVLESLRV